MNPNTRRISRLAALLTAFSLLGCLIPCSYIADADTPKESGESASVSDETATDGTTDSLSDSDTMTEAYRFSYYDNQTFADFAGLNTPHTEAVSSITVNLESGLVMFENNPLQSIYPASTVKLMTAIVAVEAIPDLETVIYASETAVNRSTGTRLNPTRPIKAGEAFTARELLYGLLVVGANDAANVLAEYVGGSVEGFCDLMNRKAAELGATNTHFTNPTGMHDDNMVTTAYDTALIARYAYFINEITKIAGTTNYTVEPTEKTRERRYLYNRNRLIRRVDGETDYFYKGALGLSSGSTPQGGNCVVAVAKREGLTYLTVVMNSPEIEEENFAYVDAHSLLDACFDGFSMQTVAGGGNMICEIPVSLAAGVDHVTLYAAEDITALLPNEYAPEDMTLKRLVYDDAKAPVREGETFGELAAVYKGTITLGETALVANASIDRSNLLYALSLLSAFFTSRWFIAAAVIAVLLFVVYCVLYYKAFMRRRRFRS